MIDTSLQPILRSNPSRRVQLLILGVKMTAVAVIRVLARPSDFAVLQAKSPISSELPISKKVSNWDKTYCTWAPWRVSRPKVHRASRKTHFCWLQPASYVCLRATCNPAPKDGARERSTSHGSTFTNFFGPSINTRRGRAEPAAQLAREVSRERLAR